MFRIFVILLLAVVIAAGIGYYAGYFDPVLPIMDDGQGNASTKDPPAKLGNLLYAPAKLDPLPPRPENDPRVLVVEPCHVVVREKQEVSSIKDGKLWFIGREVTDKEPVLPTQIRPVLSVNIFDGNKVQTRKYRPLDEGDYVEYDEVVAVVDPSLAVSDLAIKVTKVVAGKAELEATEAICKEADRRLNQLKQLAQTNVQIISSEEYGNATITAFKYQGEKIKGIEGIKQAERELDQANLILSLHFLKNTLRGKSVVKKIYKQGGEGIKAQETVLQLNNISRLRVEGTVGAQDFLALRKGQTCYLEPSVEGRPSLEPIKAHRGEITGVAICADGRHFVSGSDDHSFCVWDLSSALPLATVRLGSAVRTVAASPKTMTILVGCADGNIIAWDLTDPTKPKEVFKRQEQHRGAVTALAFSPDGGYFASGGEDNAIMLFRANGETVYALDADHGVDNPHQGTITSLAFTPQCRLVSAARDNTLRVWSLHEKGAHLLGGGPITHRGGTVQQLGVSSNGRFLLFDQGKTLQVLNIEDGNTVATLDNLGGASPFDTLALFSPDGGLMLTGGAGDGRLHLWKTPTGGDRGFQVREFVTKDRSAITSAAFGPAAKRFAITGSKEGYVHVWTLPDEDEVKHHRILVDANGDPLRLDLVEMGIEASKTRVAVNVANPRHQKLQPGQQEERLVPGQRVTLVVVLDPAGR